MKFDIRKVRISRAAMVMLILMLISVVCLPGLSARFFTSASESSRARVATFNIDFKYGYNNKEWTQTLEGQVRPGQTGKNNGTTLNIVNNSEVAVTYDIAIKRVTNNIVPMEVELYGSGGVITPSDTNNDNTVTYKVNAQPIGQTDTYSLQLSWKEDDTEGEDKNLEYMGMVDYFTITVTATQID